MTQPVTIIGGGLSGLTLGRCLLHHGIKSIIYEKSANTPRHNYGITLHNSTKVPLFGVLGKKDGTGGAFSDQTFQELQETLAVDGSVGGEGKLGKFAKSAVHDTNGGFRVNRWRLEESLRKGLDIRYDHAVETVKTGEKGCEVRFANGDVVEAEFLVAADGPHSAIRKALLPQVELEILPLVAYNGKRYIDQGVWKEMFEPAMRKSTVLEERHGDTSLNISLNDLQKERASVSWTYSRPPRGEGDALHRPNRSNAEAKQIPEELFEEVGALKDVEQPFAEIFDVEKLRKDRILHWLMRRTLIPLAHLHDTFMHKKVYFVGDAVHAEPIIGGNGANSAILDSIRLADLLKLQISENTATREDTSPMTQSYSSADYAHWELAQRENEETMWKMHGVEREQSNL